VLDFLYAECCAHPGLVQISAGAEAAKPAG
jgi:hypothetical protein